MTLLNAHPFRSGKKGKFIHLLKEGSKPILKIKNWKKYQALDVVGQIENNKRSRHNSTDINKQLLNVPLGSKRKAEANN